MFHGKVLGYRRAFRDCDFAINQRRHSAVRIETSIFRATHLLLAKLEPFQLVGKTDLFQQPDGSNGTGIGCKIDFHHRSMFRLEGPQTIPDKLTHHPYRCQNRR